MAAVWNGSGHYTVFLHCDFFLFFPHLISAVGDKCGLSANLECRSEMCCTRLTGNAGLKKSPSGHHPTTLLGYIFATKASIATKLWDGAQMANFCRYFVSCIFSEPRAAHLRPAF